MLRLVERYRWLLLALLSAGPAPLLAQKAASSAALPTAPTVVQGALTQAAKTRKNVLLVVQAPWNPWSQVLADALDEPAARQVLAKYYVVRRLHARHTGNLPRLELQTPALLALWQGNPGIKELVAKYYVRPDTLYKDARTLPAMFVLNAQGKKQAQFTGYPEDAPGLLAFGQQLRRTSAISPAELAVVRAAFVKAHDKVAPPSAAEVVQAACAQAKRENKKVFVIFHASWCHWCHVQDTAMAAPGARRFFTDKYVITHLVAHESDGYLLAQHAGSEQLLARYQGSEREGIPFSLIFDADGKFLADYNGFPLPKGEADYARFEQLLRQTAGATDDELRAIKQAFAEVAAKNGQ